MRCIGRTKDFNRCKNSTRGLVCKRHVVQLLILLFLTIPPVILNFDRIYNSILRSPRVFDAHIGGSLVSVSKLSQRRAGALLYFYDSGLGLTAAPVNVAIYTEIVNLKPTVVRIRNYSATALIQYEENGRVINLVAPLYNLPLFNNDIYFIPDDWTKASKFTLPSLDALAVTTQLRQGESLRGWSLFEMDENFREFDYKVKEIFLTVENNAHERETISIPLKEQPDGGASLSGGPIEVSPKRYDLTKLKYTIAPLRDLHQMMKQKKN